MGEIYRQDGEKNRLNIIMDDNKTQTKEEKRMGTLAIKTENLKRALLAQLRKTPIVQLACERVSVGRSTYYRWRADDRVFARAADRAIEGGRFFLNDAIESRLIRMAQDNNLGAIIFWLRHNHPKYASANRFIHEHEIVTDRPSVEEQNIGMRELARFLAIRRSPQPTVDEIKQMAEEDEVEEERDKELEERMRFFEEEK